MFGLASVVMVLISPKSILAAFRHSTKASFSVITAEELAAVSLVIVCVTSPVSCKIS